MPTNNSEDLSFSPKLAVPADSDRVRETVHEQGELPRWQEATDEFCKLVQEIDQHQGAFKKFPWQTYTSDWADAVWSELYRVDEAASEWARTTFLIPLTGSYFLPETRTPIPPVTYLKHLQASKDARQKALQRALSRTSQWQAVRAIGGDGRHGYPIVFLGIYVSNRAYARKFEPVIEAHVNNSPIAESEAHSLNRNTIRDSPEHPSNLIHELGSKVPGLKHGGILAESRNRQKMATLLYATNRRAYSFGKGSY